MLMYRKKYQRENPLQELIYIFFFYFRPLNIWTVHDNAFRRLTFIFIHKTLRGSIKVADFSIAFEVIFFPA